MKNKKIIVIIIIVLILSAIAICWLFLKQKVNKETYTIKEWSTQAQTVSIEIEDETIINSVKSKEADQEGTKTGGEYTLFTITGLKEGTTSAIVNVINEDGSVESSKKYHLEVNDKLLVSLESVEEICVIREWSTQAQTVSIEIEDETIINSDESIESIPSEVETGGKHTLFTITGLKEGTTSAIVKVVNEDGTIESSKKYQFKVSNDLKVELSKEQ